MSNQVVETFWTRLEHSASGVDAEVEYQVVAEYFPGEPGKTSGPPDKCYPPEAAEVDVTDVYEITSGSKPRVVDLEGFLDSLTSEQVKDLEGRLLLKGQQDAIFNREEARYEAQQNRILEERSYDTGED